MIGKRTVLTSIALAAALAAATGAIASDKVTLMVGGYEKQIYLPAKLAEGLGYFKDEGLDVVLLNEGAGVDAEGELLTGAVQGVVGFYDHCIDPEQGEVHQIGGSAQSGAGRSPAGF
jgi:NitT/TauT family transport system substrate-binding protein